MAFNLTPEALALMMGGLNMMAASRGGNPDLTKGGIGYAALQGLQGGLQGLQLGKQMQDADAERAQRDQKQKAIDDMLMKLNLSPSAMQSTGVMAPGVQQSPLAQMSPEQKELAKMAILSGDWKSVSEMMKPSGKFGVFDKPKEYIEMLQKTRKEAQTALAPSNESLRKFSQATDLVSKRGGFTGMTGAADTVLMKAFASMILPGEAVMSDDINIIANQEGIPGWFKSYAQQISGTGQLSMSQRQNMYNTMTSLANRAAEENQSIRSQFETDISLGQFPTESVFSRSIPFTPYKSAIVPDAKPMPGLNESEKEELARLRKELNK